MKVFLIGLPGCGKTTLGREAAQRLGKPFVDLDDEIVKGEGQSVEEIFNSLGETQFRSIEKYYLKKRCDYTSDFVMATGGGTPCFFDNIKLINLVGISIFLDTAVDEIAARMMNTELAKRPLFAGQDISTIASRIERMRMERISFYEQAHITLSGDRLSAQFVAEEVLALES
ncbi:MAG: shikimate kinase [Cyclobacteriaceae bacterium]|nr:shikimate kinase [Cyclobacteriaceae bacterium]